MEEDKEPYPSLFYTKIPLFAGIGKAARNSVQVNFAKNPLLSWGLQIDPVNNILFTSIFCLRRC